VSAALRAVVAGTGFGCVTHVRALRAAGFEVAAVVGRDPERTAERAEAFGVPLALTSFEEALALPGVDAATIATPPATHAELTLAAIAAGKHVLCEKPLARDAAEGRRMLAAAREAGVVHLLGTEFRWDAGQATLARAVAAGAVGEPRLVTVILQVPLLADASAEVPGWWADDAQGGGWLGAHGSQIIDQVRVTAGDFVSVDASLPTLAGPTMRAENAFVVHFELASGAVGVLHSSAADWGPFLVATRVAGTTGTAWIEGVGSTVKVADGDGTRTVPVGDDLPGHGAEPLPEGVVRTAYEHMTAHGLDLGPYTCLATAFHDLINGEPIAPDPAPATFVDGVAAMAVLDAARRSAAERRRVSVEPVD
jgi:predicted dehydrogenase